MWLTCLLAISRAEPCVELAAVGDLMLSRAVGRRMDRDGRDEVFSGASEELSRADLVVGNLECVLGTAPFALKKRYLLRAKPDSAAALKHAGFTILSVANNHALDCGPSGLAETTKALTRAGLIFTGLDVDDVPVIECHGLKVAMLAYCDFPHDSGGPGISYTNEARMRAGIVAARRRADVVVVYWHWGTELSSRVNARQRHLARLAAADGADLVLGCHPHVLQPIEWISLSGSRRCLVAYSLGNFVFDAAPDKRSQTEVLHVSLARDGVKAFRVSPYVIRRSRPEPAHKLTRTSR